MKGLQKQYYKNLCFQLAEMIPILNLLKWTRFSWKKTEIYKEMKQEPNQNREPIGERKHMRFKRNFQKLRTEQIIENSEELSKQQWSRYSKLFVYTISSKKIAEDCILLKYTMDISNYEQW
jgi:hypothetical protein